MEIVGGARKLCSTPDDFEYGQMGLQ